MPFAQAYKAPLLDIESLVKSGGDNSIWFSGKIIKKEEKFQAKGMPYTELTFEIQKVLKGQPASYQHPVDKTRLSKDNPPKTLQVNIFGNSLGVTQLSGLGAEFEVGTEGVFGFYGASKMAFSSLIGGSSQGAFIKQSDGRLSNTLKNNVLKISNLSQKNTSLSRTLNALKTQQAVGEGAVDASQLEDLISGLAENIYPQVQ